MTGQEIIIDCLSKKGYSRDYIINYIENLPDKDKVFLDVNIPVVFASSLRKMINDELKKV